MNKLDQILNHIQNEKPDASAEAQAAGRVSQTLFGPGSAGADQLKNCDDFRTLFPAHLQKTLSDSRRMLLEDHIRECVACRMKFDEARGVAPKVRQMPVVARSRPSTQKWVMAAAVVATLGITAFAARLFVPALDNSPRASVQSIDGVLYKLTSVGSAAIGEGAELMDGEEIRTPGNTRAVIRLADGSRVEMNERATLAVNLTWRGTVLRLDRGHIIVQAAKQKRGKLFVATGDSEVSVVGTIFSVNKGTLGSRVSVVEGRVDVQHDGRTEALKPGEQTTTDVVLSKVPVESDFAWSRDAARYLALLGELTTLQKQLEKIPSNGLRFQSRLLIFMPQDTKIFAAIPNMSVTLTEGRRVLEERLRFSEVLRTWWESKENARLRNDVQTVLDQLQTLSDYLGEEILMFVTGDEKDLSPVFVAETKDAAGLKDFLDRRLKVPGSNTNPFAYTIQNNTVIFGASAVVARGPSPTTPFRQRIEQSYRDGAGYLFAANLEQIVPGLVQGKGEPNTQDLGFNSMQYLVLERRDIAGKTDSRVTVSFKGQRQNVASWLAAPGPMGTLSFVSPDAGAAVSIVVKQPRAIAEELFQMLHKLDPKFDQGIQMFQRETGLNPIDDLAAPLGTEATVAVDGPLLPVPSWKFAVEVNQPQHLEMSIERLIEVSNRLGAPASKLVHSKEQASGRTFYSITGGRLPTEVHYTFVDSYLLMAPGRTLLTQAIQNRQSGLTLPRSDRFRAQLPSATTPNFSAVIYHNVGGTLGPMIDQFQGLLNATPAQKQSMQAIKEAQPGLIAAYAENDRITAATTGSMFGLNLGMLAGAGHGSLFNSLLQMK